MSREDQEELARQLLMSGTPFQSVVEQVDLPQLKIASIKGVLSRQNRLPGKGKGKSSGEPEVELFTDEDNLRATLSMAKVPKTTHDAIIALVDRYGYSLKGVDRALRDQNSKRATRKRVLSLWSVELDQELPPDLEEELNISSRPRGKTSYLTEDELTELLDRRDREREEKNRLTRIEMRLERLLEDRDRPTGDNSQIQALRGQVEGLREALTDQRLGQLQLEIEALKTRKSDPEQWASAAESLVSAVSQSNFGKSVARVAEFVSKDALETAYNIRLEPPDPTPAAPEQRQGLIDKMASQGLITRVGEREN